MFVRTGLVLSLMIVLLSIAGDIGAAETDSILPSAGRILIACLIVAMLIYASIFMLKKLFFKGSGRVAGSISMVGSYPMGQRSRLCLVEVAGKVLLLGITPQQISRIDEFEPSEIEEIEKPSKVKSFIKHLQDFSAKQDVARGSSTG
ncbi:MAG: flagellar biosynthetic protein FliO [Candidatus Krumholzibacteriota bacterium]|nr:flagellar biosynthetic protein FliO [Candidatus Krumholzibacteriota bacterium]